MDETPKYKDLAYVAGEIAALRALILALGKCVGIDKFHEAGLRQLEISKTALLPTNVPEPYLAAIHSFEKWLLDGQSSRRAKQTRAPR